MNICENVFNSSWVKERHWMSCLLVKAVGTRQKWTLYISVCKKFLAAMCYF